MSVHEGPIDPSVIVIAASVLGVTTIIVAFLGCMWCRNKWKRFTQRHYQLSPSNRESSLTPVPNLTEFTIFPPPSSNQFSLPTGISPDEVVFEPLPEIRSRVLGTTSENVRPARFMGSCEKISLQDWFDEHQVNFPRDHLKYLREIGSTWYGLAVEGEAYGIKKTEEKTKVVVKILRMDATSTELMQYLQETRSFRDLKHPNMLTLLNRCLEVHPFLLVMEHCDTDLKSYLVEQRKSPESLLKGGILLRMACNITSALQYMHEHGFIHMDIAAHSCVVTSDGIIKIGDYGTAVHLHKDDFYCLGDVAFPIRWCAPESLMCTESVIEAKDITREANIWSFGVVLWELLEFGKLPYVNMNDNDVIQKVLIEYSLKLEQPKTPCVHKDMIYKIMQFCWLPPSLRPTIQKVSTLLNYLYDNRDVVSESAAFEARWNSLQPAPRDHSLRSVLSDVPLRFESDFAPRRELDCDSLTSAEFDRCARGDKSPSSGSFSAGELGADMSPSLLNLRGSVEDLIADEAQNGERSNSACTSEPLSLETLPVGSETSDSDSLRLGDGHRDVEAADSIALRFGDGHKEVVAADSIAMRFGDGHRDLEAAEPIALRFGDFHRDLEAADSIQLRISEAIHDLDTILDEEVTSSDTSKCNTPEKKPDGAFKHLTSPLENGKSLPDTTLEVHVDMEPKDGQFDDSNPNGTDYIPSRELDRRKSNGNVLDPLAEDTLVLNSKRENNEAVDSKSRLRTANPTDHIHVNITE